mgnify:CR=1 FL=1
MVNVFVIKVCSLMRIELLVLLLLLLVHLMDLLDLMGDVFVILGLILVLMGKVVYLYVHPMLDLIHLEDVYVNKIMNGQPKTMAASSKTPAHQTQPPQTASASVTKVSVGTHKAVIAVSHALQIQPQHLKVYVTVIVVSNGVLMVYLVIK